MGLGRIRAFVCIDETPKPIIEKADDWGFITSPEHMKSPQQSMHDRAAGTAKFVASMITRPLTKQEMEWWVDQPLRTPTHVAVLTDLDSSSVDYTEEAKAIDAKIPVLIILRNRQSWVDSAKTWLAKYAPNTEVVALKGGHLLHWEFPDQFNAALDTFLTKLK